jgi:predicted Zn-dependent protease
MNIKIIFSSIIITLGLNGISCSSENVTSAVQCYEKGIEKQKQQKRSEAFAYFKLASKKDPSNPLYYWAAATSAENRNDALVNAEDAWLKGLKSPQVLFFRIALSQNADKQTALSYALQGYDEMPDSFKTPEVHGEIFYRFAQFDTALSLWKPLYAKTPSSHLSIRIAMAYSGKGQTEKARQILTEARNKNLLDRQGYSALASLFAFMFEYKSIDTLFHEMHQRGFFNDTAQVEYADILLAQERYDDAENVLNRIKMPATQKNDEDINFQARTRLYLIYYMLKQPEKIKQLDKMVPDNLAYAKTEKKFTNAILDLETGTSKNLAEFEVLRKALPHSTAIDLLFSRLNAERGNLEKAGAGYASLSPVFNRSPRVLVERAILCVQKGKDDEALALIQELHGRNLFTKQSLELFRDIMLKKKLLEKSQFAQKVLEERYPNDASVRYHRGMSALTAQNYDTALAVFTALAKAYPKEENFEVMRISVFMMKKDFNRVLRECSTSTASPAALASLQAGALERSGRNDDAKQVFENALAKNRTKNLLLEYANFLINNKQPNKAVTIFEELIAADKKKPDSDKKETALLYNNLAWSLVSSDSCSPSRLLDAARHAYELAPENLTILDTYSEALLKTDRYDDCIKLLKDNPLVVKEPQLLFHLGTAYEKKKFTYEASRTYTMACAALDSTSSQLPVGFNKSELTARIQTLNETK